MPRSATKSSTQVRPSTVDQLKLNKQQDVKSISFLNDYEDDNDLVLSQRELCPSIEQESLENFNVNESEFDRREHHSSDNGSDIDVDILNDEKWDTDIEEEGNFVNYSFFFYPN